MSELLIALCLGIHTAFHRIALCLIRDFTFEMIVFTAVIQVIFHLLYDVYRFGKPKIAIWWNIIWVEWTMLTM